MITPRYRFRYKNTKAQMVYLGQQLASNTGHLFRKSTDSRQPPKVTVPSTWGFIKRPMGGYGLWTADETPLRYFSIEDMIYFLKSMLAISQMQTREVTRFYQLIDRKMGLNTPAFPLGRSHLALGEDFELESHDYPELTL